MIGQPPLFLQSTIKKMMQKLIYIPSDCLRLQLASCKQLTVSREQKNGWNTMKYMEALLLTHKGRNYSRKYNLSSSYLELKIAKPSDTRWPHMNTEYIMYIESFLTLSSHYSSCKRRQGMLNHTLSASPCYLHCRGGDRR